MHPSSRIHRTSSRAAGLAVLFALASCSPGGSSGELSDAAPGAELRIPASSLLAADFAQDLAPLAVGDLVERPDAAPGESQHFFVDPNSRGRASEIRIASMTWGRLVDVYGLNGQGRAVVQQREMVIDPNLATDGVDFRLESGAISGVERLVILRDVTDLAAGGGLDEFLDLLRVADANLAPVDTLDGDDPGPFTMVPRNAALVVQFDDLLDAREITAENLRLMTGTGFDLPFSMRVLADANHGSLTVLPGESQRRFFTTRVLLDFAVSSADSMSTFLPVNAAGLPAANQTALANLLLRIPTRANAAAGQASFLRNPTGGALATTGNGPVDLGSSTVDVLRAARSGGPTSVTGDPSNGFLVDVRPPRVVGTLLGNLDRRPKPVPGGSPFEFTLPRIQFESTFCARDARVGDLVEVPGFLAEVTGPAPVNADGQAFDVPILLLGGDPVAFRHAALGEAAYHTVFDPAQDAARAACFVTVLPGPAGGGASPRSRIHPNSVFTVRFTEALDPTSFEAHEGLALTRSAAPTAGSEFIVGHLISSPDLANFAYVPALPLAHQSGATENVYLTMGIGSDAPTDLAGNALVDALPQVAFRIDRLAASEVNGGRVTRFTSIDEEEPIGDAMTGPLPEWTGQFTLDQASEALRPRPVTRTLAAADRTQALPSIMSPVTSGVQTPLSPLGSKSQAVWRYSDLGLSVDDVAQFNLDVEGLYWSPLGGQVLSDTFDEFEIRLSHGERQPDETFDPGTLFPHWPLSGLVTDFAANTLAGTQAEIVHPRQAGYTIDPGDLFQSSGGTPLMPFPLNRDVPPDEVRTYTWRDSTLAGRGAPNGDGADPESVTMAGLPRNQLYSSGEVRGVALPLLMEFRCYPGQSAAGLNALDVSLAVNSSARPYFRAFSAGGIDSNGMAVTVDPDLETTANGGFNPVGGLATTPGDSVFQIGALDLVVRVSQVVSVWLPADVPSGDLLASPRFLPAVVTPGSADQPVGTQVEIAYRGATAIVAGSDVLRDANALDIYGDHYAPGDRHDAANANLDVTFLDGDDSWHADIADIEGASYYQIRITLRANITTGEVPRISSIGLAWTE